MDQNRIAQVLEDLIEWEAGVFGGSGSPCWREARQLLAELRGRVVEAEDDVDDEE